MSKEKTINTIKYIMSHSPNNDRWNNIWIDEYSTSEEFREVYNSLIESGFMVEFNRGNYDIPDNIDIIMSNALEEGLKSPIWGEVLTEIKNNREKQIDLPKAISTSGDLRTKLDDNIPKIQNRPIDTWFVQDPEPTLEGKAAIMAREADARRLKNKESLSQLRQEFKNKKQTTSNMDKALEQAKSAVDILPKLSDGENIEKNTEVEKRKLIKVARSNSSR